MTIRSHRLFYTETYYFTVLRVFTLRWMTDGLTVGIDDRSCNSLLVLLLLLLLFCFVCLFFIIDLFNNVAKCTYSSSQHDLYHPANIWNMDFYWSSAIVHLDYRECCLLRTDVIYYSKFLIRHLCRRFLLYYQLPMGVHFVLSICTLMFVLV